MNYQDNTHVLIQFRGYYSPHKISYSSQRCFTKTHSALCRSIALARPHLMIKERSPKDITLDHQLMVEVVTRLVFFLSRVHVDAIVGYVAPQRLHQQDKMVAFSEDSFQYFCLNHMF